VTPWSRGVSMLVDSAMVDVVAVSISMLIQYFDIGVGSRVKKEKRMELSESLFLNLHSREQSEWRQLEELTVTLQSR
jgi:hypothetical protein